MGDVVGWATVLKAATVLLGQRCCLGDVVSWRQKSDDVDCTDVVAWTMLLFGHVVAWANSLIAATALIGRRCCLGDAVDCSDVVACIDVGDCIDVIDCLDVH